MLKTNILNELTLENITDWPLELKYFIAVLWAILIIVFPYFLFFKLQLNLYYQLNRDEQELKTQFLEKKLEIKKLSEYKNQEAKLKSALKKFLEFSLYPNNLPTLLELVSHLALQKGLNIESLKPSPTILHEDYQEIPISLKIYGTYLQIADFISQLAELSKLINFGDFSLKQSEKSKKNFSGYLDCRIILKIYLKGGTFEL